MAAAAYTLLAVARPLADHAAQTSHGNGLSAVTERFGPQTPGGILRNLRYVETNPPSEYSRSIDHPERHYPSRLRLSLHLPAALAGLTLLNTLVGLLAADLTGGFSPQVRRRARWAIGVAGGVACFAALAAATVFDRDWSNVSGVLGVVTGMAAAVATGSAGPETTLLHLTVFAASCAAAAVWWEVQASKRELAEAM